MNPPYRPSYSLRANLISTKVSASHRKSTQVHASPGQTKSQVEPSLHLASLARAFSKLLETRFWKVTVYVEISFHSRDAFSHFFVRPGFHLFCARLAVHYLAVYLVSMSLLCVSVRYNNLFIS